MSMPRIAAKPGDIRGSTGEYSDISGALTVCIAYSACADGLESVPYRRWEMQEVSLDANRSESSGDIIAINLCVSATTTGKASVLRLQKDFNDNNQRQIPGARAEIHVARATFWLRSILIQASATAPTFEEPI